MDDEPCGYRSLGRVEAAMLELLQEVEFDSHEIRNGHLYVFFSCGVNCRKFPERGISVRYTSNPRRLLEMLFTTGWEILVNFKSSAANVSTPTSSQVRDLFARSLKTRETAGSLYSQARELEHRLVSELYESKRERLGHELRQIVRDQVKTLKRDWADVITQMEEEIKLMSIEEVHRS